jgi:arylsulfatase
MTDDVGFAASSTFGGPIPTPTMSSLAAKGIRYNNFNTTALCSPSRAALLTGRNPNSVNMGDVSNEPSPYDGYTSVIPKSAATVAEILKQNGYSTAAFGKWHLTPEWEQSAMGPFDHWPIGMGFEYFYGFINASTDQFAPTLVEGTVPVTQSDHTSGYVLDHDLAAHAVRWIRQHHAIAPERPFFLYYAPGSTHQPQQAPNAWIERFRGQFDVGWDVLRERTFSRQKTLGIIPANAKLTPRPKQLLAWDSLSPEERRLAARFMEAYAGQLAFCDEQIGQVIDALKETGDFSNTLIIYIQGDNGASGEGGLKGDISGGGDTVEYALQHIDDIGGPRANNIYPAEWAWALDTPFQWFKQIASHFGGTRNAMVVEWAAHTSDPAIVRSQFSYIDDIMPTVLDAAGIAAPTTVSGVKQMPLDGTSLRYTFLEATAGTRHNTQYFTMVQNVGIYHDGWIAATTPIYMPWEYLDQKTVELNGRTWELYHVDDDYSEANDLAAKEKGKLRELQRIYRTEAEKNHALPLMAPGFGAQDRPSLARGRKSFEFLEGVSGIYEDAAPNIMNKSFTVTADIQVLHSDTTGALLAQGGQFGGYAFYLIDGRPAFSYNVAPDVYTVRSTERVSPGRHVLTLEFQYDGGVGAGGWAIINIDGAQVARDRIGRTIGGFGISYNEGLDIGADLITPVSEDYKVPAKFDGTIYKVTVTLK